MRILLAFILTLCVFSSEAQGITVSGFIYGDHKDNPLPYVNISVIATSQGAISNGKGFFTLKLSSDDSIYVSHVGYQSVRLAARDFKGSIILSSQTQQLNTIEILSSKKIIKKHLGFDKEKARHFFAGPLQYAVFIKNVEGKPGFISSLNFTVSHAVSIKQKDRKRSQIRIRIYQPSISGHGPGKDLLRENIIVLVSPNDRTIRVDVSRFSIPFPVDGAYIGIDVLGYIENNELVSYYVRDAKKHLQISFCGTTAQGVTYINPTGKKWNLYNNFVEPGKPTPSILNACFGATVEF